MKCRAVDASCLLISWFSAGSLLCLCTCYTAAMNRQPPQPKNTPAPPAQDMEDEDTEQLAWDECAKPMAKFVTRCLDDTAKNPEKDTECQRLYQESAYCYAPLLFPREDQALAKCFTQVFVCCTYLYILY